MPECPHCTAELELDGDGALRCWRCLERWVLDEDGHLIGPFRSRALDVPVFDGYL